MTRFISVLLVLALYAATAAEIRAAPPKDQGLVLCTSQKIRGNWLNFEKISLFTPRPADTELVNRYFKAQLKEAYNSGILERVRVQPSEVIRYMEGTDRHRGKEGDSEILVLAFLDANYKARSGTEKYCGDVCEFRRYLEVFDVCYLAWPMKVCINDEGVGKRC